MTALGPTELIILASVLLLFCLLPLVALIDILRSQFKGSNDKVIWVIVVLFLNVLGALLYFFIGRNQRIS